MEIGAVVAGRYRLDRRLGAGGMGTVWAATHLTTHKAFALKFIDKKNDDEGARKRVLREARASCAVTHPNVVAVHDVVEGEDGTPILVMDLLRGESLAARLARAKTLGVKDALAIARPVGAALEAAHAVGIVHRDLKPDNIFLCEDGGVKILDFGVAKLRGKDAATKETNRLTATGAMIGTPHYMAPEQAFGEGDVDARADLWALGAVLYESLTGVPPTAGENLGQILKALAIGQIRPLQERAPGAPEAVARLVDGLLQVERDKRMASATEILRAIDAIDAPAAKLELAVADARAADATSLGPATRTADPPPPRRVWPLALGIAAIAGAAGLYATRAENRAPPAATAIATPTPTPDPTPVLTPTPTPIPTPTPTPSPTPTPTPSPTPTPTRTPTPTPKKPAPPPSASAAGPLLTNVPF